MTTKAFYGMGAATQAGDYKLEGDKIYGVYVGIVTDNVHPDGEYMVRVRYPAFWDPDQDQSWWCRIATGMGGIEMGGFYLLPEIDDEVLISFLQGDPNNPIVVGALWNGKDNFPKKLLVTPDNEELPIPNVDQGGENNYRWYRSRSGHKLVFDDEAGKLKIALRSQAQNELVLDDTDGKEKIQLYDKDNLQWMEINVPDKTITLQTDTGDIILRAKKKIILECEDYTLTATKTIKSDAGTTSDHKAGTNMTHVAGSNMDLKAGGILTEKASLIKLN